MKKPEIGQEYYYIGTNLCVQQTVYLGSIIEDEQIKNGNYFPKGKFTLSDVAQLCNLVQNKLANFKAGINRHHLLITENWE